MMRSWFWKILIIVTIGVTAVASIVMLARVMIKPTGSVGTGLAASDVEKYVSALPTEKEVGSGVKGIILPHHMLVSGFVEQFYAMVASQNSYDEIVMISPNHFGIGFNYIQTSDKIEGHNFLFDQEGIDWLNQGKYAVKENKLFPREHGVWTQEKFLAKHFPKTKVIPIIIKENTPREKLDKLVAGLVEFTKKKENEGKKVLILASIDFSHYSSEEGSRVNDRKMVKWLSGLDSGSVTDEELYNETLDLQKSADQSVEGAVGVDSPGSVYAMAQMMRKLGATKFVLWNRTSTADLIKGTKAEDNTSHIFGSFG